MNKNLTARAFAVISAAVSAVMSAIGLSRLNSQSSTVARAEVARNPAVLHSFDPSRGSSFPSNSLIQGRDGHFYSSTVQGGPNITGSIYKVTPDGIQTELYAFPLAGGGAYPSALTAGNDGDFYGTTSAGGAHNNGTIYKITSAGVHSLLYSFGVAPDGNHPKAGLIQANDHNFYGTTCAGGEHNCGTIFKLTPAGIVSVIYSFSATPDGDNPLTNLTQPGDGHFYGTTISGGEFNGGTLFRY